MIELNAKPSRITSSLIGLSAPSDLDQVGVDAFWMERALALAQQAESLGEVPVGALVVIDGVCVSEAFNQPISQSDPTAHAEMLALREAAKKVQNYRLVNATLYVTLEPCTMCAGALIHARVQRVVYATTEPRTGAAGSVFNVLQNDQLNHRCEVHSGLMADQASEQLRRFFKARR
ncbi:MAG: tRNA adenosine(34) deaminase TadA [Thiotrichales bacterium 34-46-19]|nr:MAG: tRNA adenosine(34) deaminase TadA [Thiotrichales bacterium 35-46-9]OYZ07946.1 MAG: tRNA adenosine(34) deaminase TadA [Thiotrichales bacterium 16-46-22]OZA18378.1 MAG: tRNA adenosine(34) deaminase TadA [Thiotrichales bacterium 17-46-47]OZA73989.1 MAG: tRNA adenosine(34) deaminase TadA [Thiotrichales bacterium 39-47-5]OZA96805.1 MAG: tRNA adenosine(34) deaminase TadA [Thiotrichales bacterium 34-46-19]OZB86780.1 MAG: tRNA adenosine(34) deaminase TadA [Thiotrichales bacterium 12-47-6]UCG1